MSPPPNPPPPPPGGPGRSPRGQGFGGGQGREQQMPRWVIWVVAGLLLAVFVVPTMMSRNDRTKIGYSDLRSMVAEDKVSEITWSNDGGDITGTLKDGTEFTSTGPDTPTEDDLALFREHDV